MAAYQAAIDGLGVALGRHPLVAPDLKAGRLVVPFDFKMSSEFAYYLVYPPEAIRRRKIKAFRDWLMPLAEVRPARRLDSSGEAPCDFGYFTLSDNRYPAQSAHARAASSRTSSPRRCGPRRSG